MSELETNHYAPDYIVTPGEVLEDYLGSLNMTQADLSERTGMARKTINEIIKGKAPVAPETALKFERVLGRPAHFWSNLERQYQDDLVRRQEEDRLQAHLTWLKAFPVRAMIAHGLMPKLADPSAQLDALLRFFGVVSPRQWNAVWRSALPVAYRQTGRSNQHFEAIATWLRRGELEAQDVRCSTYDRKRFQAVLAEIRDLTTAEPSEFDPRMRALCADAGVVLLFVPELPGAGVYGATRWLNGVPVIQLSLYRKSNDHFWFTFFHEAAHILKHGRKEVFVECKGLSDEKEREADEFACNFLVPSSQLRTLMTGGQPTLSAIRTFADGIGVAPGIVVGRLQHDKVVPMNVGNGLKVRFEWQDTPRK